MKIEFDKQKSIDALSDAIYETTKMGKKISVSVQNTANDISEKKKNDSISRKLKKYNPLFPETFKSKEFNLPNMVVIVDDAVRRGIDVCEGSIGWLNNETGMEVLYLYDEYITESGIEFVPAPMCDAVYYVDRFDRNRFVQIDCIFSRAQEERLAELEHIAYSLGAKFFSVDIEVSEEQTTHNKNTVSLSGNGFIKGIKVHGGGKTTNTLSSKEKSEFEVHTKLNLKGNDNPVVPTLKWFAYDDSIKGLIQMRCEDINSVESKDFELAGSTFASMSTKAAANLDATLKKLDLGAKASYDFESKATRENRSKLYFHIEF